MNQREEGKADRRSARTRRQLREALLELVVEKDYDKITIQEIVDRADVGRTTFYAHFQTKDELLVGAARDSGGARHEFLRTGDVLDVSSLFEHLRENFHLFEPLKNTDGWRVAKQSFCGQLEARWSGLLDQLDADLEPSERDTVVQFLTGGLWTLMVWWLEQGMPLSSQEMSQRFETLARRGLRGVV